MVYPFYFVTTYFEVVSQMKPGKDASAVLENQAWPSQVEDDMVEL